VLFAQPSIPNKIEPFNNSLLGPIIDGRQLRGCISAGEVGFNGGGVRIVALGGLRLWVYRNFRGMSREYLLRIVGAAFSRENGVSGEG